MDSARAAATMRAALEGAGTPIGAADLRGLPEFLGLPVGTSDEFLN